jgi:hypothetical protein
VGALGETADLVLPRFSMLVGFEGERKYGTRHAHVLVYIPVPTKKRISHDMLLNLFPSDFRFLWNRLRGDRSGGYRNSLVWADDRMALRFGRANRARSIYAVKDVRQRDVPWSRCEFVTLPKQQQFYDGNSTVIRGRMREQQQEYARYWAEQRIHFTQLEHRLKKFEWLADPPLARLVV